MPMRSIPVAAVALLLCALGPSAGVAECRLPPEEAARLKTLSSGNWLSPQNRYHAEGVFYLDHHCFLEARKALTAALEGEGDETLRESTTGFLLLLDALETRDKGELKSARSKLVEILKNYYHSALLERVPFLLSELLNQVPDPEVAKFLEEQLRDAPRTWMLRTVLLRKLLAEGRGAEALAQIEEELAGELEAPRRIELQIQLASLLFAQRRVAEAQLLLTSLDSDVGEKVMDRNLRISFLLLAVQVWAERVRRGGDPGAAQKLEAYSKAYNQTNPALKP